VRSWREYCLGNPERRRRVGCRCAPVVLGAVLVACSTVAPLPGPGGADIPWSPDRPLAWGDFRGAVDPQAPPERVAMTAASLTWGYEYQIEHDGESCAYWITEIRSEAVFDQRRSWVRPTHRKPEILAHEQGHFDLTQIYKQLLDERAAELIGLRQRCEGSTIEQASSFTQRDAAESVQAVFDAIWTRYMAAQRAYDEQTAHGISAGTQRRWSEKIQSALESGAWSDPA